MLKTTDQLSTNEFAAIVMSGWVIADVIILPFNEIFTGFKFKQGTCAEQNNSSFGHPD